MKTALLGGALLCFTAIAVGAFGAHALQPLLELNERVDVFELANRYHFYQGLGLLLIAAVDGGRYSRFKSIVFSILSGTVVFCGSLYALAILDFGWLGAVTPVGGALLLFGWGAFVSFIVTGKSA